MKLTISESFGDWLRRQSYRNDPVGDLARDFKDSGSKASTFYGVRRNMAKHGACQGAWNALDVALEQWDGK